ncbi:Zinc finger protein, partial [Pseudolycoriella hygida]
CLKQFNDQSDIVPLFEPYENIFYYQICNELQLLVQPDDQLGSNVCRVCSDKIMTFYEFVTKYNESDKKLRDMLREATVDVFEEVDRKPNINDYRHQVEYQGVFDETIVCVKTENVVDDADTKPFIANISVTDPISVKWKCPLCLLEFKTRLLLKKHKKMHLELDKGVESIQVQHLQEPNIPASVSNRLNEFVCDTCNKTFNSKNKIKQHLVTHINEGRRKFLCVKCGNQFCSKFGLTQHIRAIHDKEQRFQCTKCSRKFAHKHNLKTHMNRHNGIRPYACNVCTKTFYDSSTLNVHTKSVHSQTNEFACSICSKTFNRNGNLKIHMVKTHHIQHPKGQGTAQRVKMKVE